MLLVMNNKTRAKTGERLLIDDYAPLVASGVRFPWKDRITLANRVDFLNDEMPSYAAVGLVYRESGLFASAITISATLSKRLPRLAKTVLYGATEVYRAAYIAGFNGLTRSMAGRKSSDMESVVCGGYAGLFRDGFVIGVNDLGKPDTFYANVLAYAISVYNDRRYFWEVMAVEPFFSGYPAKVFFSIDEEYIKSLFYARSIPITDTGRLRPILHWVSAHKRRIKEGIDIDVRNHLRGITSFEMHNVSFKITAPFKKEKDVS